MALILFLCGGGNTCAARTGVLVTRSGTAKALLSRFVTAPTACGNHCRCRHGCIRAGGAGVPPTGIRLLQKIYKGGKL